MATLNEVYTECVFYKYHGALDVEKIISKLNDLKNMDRTGEFFESDRNRPNAGFISHIPRD